MSLPLRSVMLKHILANARAIYGLGKTVAPRSVTAVDEGFVLTIPPSPKCVYVKMDTLVFIASLKLAPPLVVDMVNVLTAFVSVMPSTEIRVAHLFSVPSNAALRGPVIPLTILANATRATLE